MAICTVLYLVTTEHWSLVVLYLVTTEHGSLVLYLVTTEHWSLILYLVTTEHWSLAAPGKDQLGTGCQPAVARRGSRTSTAETG